MRWLLPLLLLAGCASWPRGLFFYDPPTPGPEIAFTTTCSIKVAKPLPPEWTQDAAQATEDRMLLAFGRVMHDARFWDACRRLSGWTVIVDPKPELECQGDFGPFACHGVTYCDRRVIVVDNRAPDRGALAHEAAHAVQGCTPVDDGKIYADYHFGWEPIRAALRAEGLPE